MKLLDCLSEQGPLQDILPGFSPRPQQIQMAQAVEEGLANGRKVIIEAGTGVGKSLAYLLPSAIWAVENKKKVVIATYTKALQEQLIGKDLPIVQKVLKAKGVDLNFSLLMGSENYLCLQRLHQTLEGGADLFASAAQQGTLESLTKWADGASTGLRSRIPRDVPQEVWESINRDPDICLGKKGPYWETCLYRKDVNRARAAHILVVNQHLLLAGLPSWLDFDAVVIDEAHNLEDVAVSCLGVTLTEQKIKRLLDDTFNPKTARGAVPRLRKLPQALREGIKGDVNRAQKTLTEFFIAVREKLRLVQGFDVGLGSNAKRVLEPQIIEDHLTGLLESIETALQGCLAHSDSKEEENQLAALSKRYLETIKHIRRFLKCEEKDYAYWGELRTVRKKPSTIVCVKPIDVSAALREMIFDKNLPIILTSATLSANRSFQHFKDRVGATETKESLVDSPFDYESNARLLVPHGFPDPSTKAEEYDRWVVEFCSRLIEHVPGGIFFLFTNWKTLKTVAAAIKSKGVKRSLYIQGDELPTKLLENFKSAKTGLLLGTDTFWQGVDVPGPELSCVVITKLPFMPPDTPLEQSRQEWYVRQGKDPFNDYVLPRAVIKFRQGFGRLIRTQKDFGAVIVLDPRVRTKNYGKIFLNSIPKCPEVGLLKDISEFFSAKTGGANSGHPDENAVLALVGAWNTKLPRSSVANVLRGAASSDVIKINGQAIFESHFGRLKGRDYQALMALIDNMLERGRLSLRQGHLEISGDNRAVQLASSPAGHE
jgi:ATP-dependent DNA helicase DinG